jgi:hypothetical protein
VELTHDVLCAVVKLSRDRRQEREAREATERLLAEQRSRELAAHRAAVRARGIAGGCAVLAALAVVAAIYGYVSSERARRAEAEAQQTRALAEQARGQAEHLVAYLSDDFARELESFGRLEVLAEFSQRQIDYFHGLPPTLRGAESIRNGALALVHHARALRTLGQLDVAGANADEAVRLLTGLRDGGDRSEATLIALALADAAQARVLESRGDPRDLPTNERAVALLQPLISASPPSPAAQRAYVTIATRIGWEQGSAHKLEEAVRTEREVMGVATALGARDLRDLDMAAYYAEAGGWLATSLVGLGRYDEGRRASNDSLAVADRVLERRPGDRLALHAEQVLTGMLAQAAEDELDPAAALGPAARQEQASLTLLKLDPNNVTSLNNLAVAEGQLADALWSAGRLRESMPYRLKQLDAQRRAAAGGAQFVETYSGALVGVVFAQASLGDAAAATSTLAAGKPQLAQWLRNEPASSAAVVLSYAGYAIAEAFAAYERDDYGAAGRAASGAVRSLQAMTPQGEQAKFIKQIIAQFAYDTEARAEYFGGEFAAAERSETAAAAERKAAGVDSNGDHQRLDEILTWLALAQGRQGHVSEAARTIAPVIEFERQLATRNHGDRWQPQALASALYVQALTDPARRGALLGEAQRLLDGLAPEVRATRDAQLWRQWVRQPARNP